MSGSTRQVLGVGSRGFTLVELVIVIAITGIVAVVGAVLIQGTVGGYVDQNRRAELVDIADRALRRMAREIRPALPNSLQLSNCSGGNPCVEFLATSAGGRYREGPGPSVAQARYRLQFNQDDARFNAMGPDVGRLPAGPNRRIAVYNTGQAGNDAWNPTNPGPISEPGFTVNAGGGGVPEEANITLTNPHQFLLESPRQRFYVVDGPVAFACEGSELARYDGYAIGANYTTGSRSLLAENVSAGGCNFSYAAGTSTRAGLLTMRLVLTDEGESVNLLHQVHVDNAP